MNNNNSICGYCKKDDSRILYPTFDIFGNDFTINHCNQCKAFFLSPRPSEVLLAKAYDDSYYGKKDEKFEGKVEQFINYFRNKRAGRLSKYLKDGSFVLDIGCGNGKFLKSLLQFGKYELHGIEMEGNSAKRAARIQEIKLKMGALQPDDFKKESVDAISLFHVFEHLTEPKETLEILSNIIKKDGILMISIPNIDSFQSSMFKGKWLHLDPPRHLFFFSPKDFKELLLTFGFEVIEEKHFITEQNPFGMVQSILNCFTKKREVLYEALKGNTEYAKEYSNFNIQFQRLFFMCSFPLFIVTDWVASLFRKGATVEYIFRKK
jgi:2-polyprenyl-3-methyl-5-hydroxy-6-metoxy-1,4-benzoquinol methylase